MNSSLFSLKAIGLCLFFGFAFLRADARTADKPENSLPVVLLPAKPGDNRLVLYITGDGGWTKFCQQLSSAYAAKGIPVVGLNTLKYFWKKKTPEQAAADVAFLLRKYLTEWHRDKIILSGCSFGADVAPFIYRRLPEDLRSKVVLVQLLSASASTDFEVHLADMAGSEAKRDFNVVDEARLLELPVVCTYGKEEHSQPLTRIRDANFRHIQLDGDHRYTEKMVPAILNSVD